MLRRASAPAENGRQRSPSPAEALPVVHEAGPLPTSQPAAPTEEAPAAPPGPVAGAATGAAAAQREATRQEQEIPLRQRFGSLQASPPA
jgi:hypothetical protein